METTLGERIALARKRARMSQGDLATAVGLGDRTTVSKWEGGVVPEGKFLLQLPEALGVTADWLLLGVGDPKPRPAGEAERILGEIRKLLATPSDADDLAELAELERADRTSGEGERGPREKRRLGGER